MLDEKIYKSKKDISYVFRRNKDSNHLIIVFSGYSNNPKIKAPYNYMSTLMKTNINQLFIADNYGYDNRGCWYIGENGTYDVEKSVIELITFILEKYNIKKENVILAGTSKGGFASLYYGTKYKFGHIICGAPQVFISKYLDRIKNKNILKAIIKDDNDKERIDNILINQGIFENTEVNILCGVLDHHLNNHVIPYIQKNKENKNINLELFYGGHDVIGNIFKDMLPNMVQRIIKGKSLEIVNLSPKSKVDNSLILDDIKNLLNPKLISVCKEKDIIKTHINVLNINLKYACYLYDGKKVIEKRRYQDNPYFEFDDKTSIRDLKVKWFIKDKNNNIISILSSDIIKNNK